MSEHSKLEVWHVDVEFAEWVPPADLVSRWANEKVNANETWPKRPLAVGTDSSCTYSCGEVEIAARLRNAGMLAYWVSEWSGFPHVTAWQDYCVKRTELRERAPDVWDFDQELRADPRNEFHALGKQGGHPDVAAVTADGHFYIEYKGPGDSIKPKQSGWATAVIEREQPRLVYLAVRGSFRARIAKSARDSSRGLEPRVGDPLPLEESGVSKARSSAKADGKLAMKNVPKGKLHRRTISDTLKRQRGWEIVSRVDGYVDFRCPRSTNLELFASEVRQAVTGLGYEPTVRIARDSAGREFVRVYTPETVAQAGRGADRS